MIESHDACQILDALEMAEVDVWIDGGWGVDALVGRQTRPHSDLDLTIDIEQVEVVRAALGALGFAVVEDELPTRFVMRDDAGRQIDFHPVTFDGSGSAFQKLPDGTRFEYTAAGLAGEGIIGARPVRCISPELQLAAHQGYEPDDIDFHDVRLLVESFGLPLPPGYEPE